MTKAFDIVVLGGGTGGYSAAFRASELGFKVALVERDKLGGTCLHHGCVPAKSLLQSAELVETIRKAPTFGIHLDRERVVWSEVLAAKNKTVAAIYSGLKELAKARGVEVIAGVGRLDKQVDQVYVETADGLLGLGFKHLVLATGSRPRPIPGLVGDDNRVITSDEALELPEVPGSVLILGGGYVGVEFASLWRTFGSRVTIVEMAPRLMVHEDAEITELLGSALEARGIEILLESKLVSTETNGQVLARVETAGRTVEVRADKLLVAVGRTAITEAFAGTGVEIESGYVKVDEKLMTSRPRVYAVGDLLATPQLAHVAFAEGIFVAETITGLAPEPIDYTAEPHCVYSHPEVAAVGLTEEEARRSGKNVVVARGSFSANARAKIAGEGDGRIKIVAEAGGGILGIHLIGAKVTEMISEAMLLIGWEAQAEEVVRMLHPHPTLSEAIGETAMKLAGKPLHML